MKLYATTTGLATQSKLYRSDNDGASFYQVGGLFGPTTLGTPNLGYPRLSGLLSTNLYMVFSTEIWHFNGAVWSRVLTADPGEAFISLRIGNITGDGWACGHYGTDASRVATVRRLTAGSWGARTTLPGSTGYSARGVWINGDDAWVTAYYYTGAASKIFRYGGTWALDLDYPTAKLSGIYGFDNGDVFVGGNKTAGVTAHLLHWDKSTWTNLAPPRPDPWVDFPNAVRPFGVNVGAASHLFVNPSLPAGGVDHCYYWGGYGWVDFSLNDGASNWIAGCHAGESLYYNGDQFHWQGGSAGGPGARPQFWRWVGPGATQWTRVSFGTDYWPWFVSGIAATDLDLDPPNISMDPPDGSVDVVKDKPLLLQFTDTESDVVRTSLRVWVRDVLVYNGSNDTFAPGYLSSSVTTNTQRGFNVLIVPDTAQYWRRGERVVVSAECDDTATNHASAVFAFTAEDPVSLTIYPMIIRSIREHDESEGT